MKYGQYVWMHFKIVCRHKLVVLKLTNVIAWSWWWVLSPILIPGGIGVAAVLIMLIGDAVVRVFDRRKTDDR